MSSNTGREGSRQGNVTFSKSNEIQSNISKDSQWHWRITLQHAHAHPRTWVCACASIARERFRLGNASRCPPVQREAYYYYGCHTQRCWESWRHHRQKRQAGRADTSKRTSEQMQRHLLQLSALPWYGTLEHIPELRSWPTQGRTLVARGNLASLWTHNVHHLL